MLNKTIYRESVVSKINFRNDTLSVVLENLKGWNLLPSETWEALSQREDFKDFVLQSGINFSRNLGQFWILSCPDFTVDEIKTLWPTAHSTFDTLPYECFVNNPARKEAFLANMLAGLCPVYITYVKLFPEDGVKLMKAITGNRQLNTSIFDVLTAARWNFTPEEVIMCIPKAAYHSELSLKSVNVFVEAFNIIQQNFELSGLPDSWVQEIIFTEEVLSFYQQVKPESPELQYGFRVYNPMDRYSFDAKSEMFIYV